MLPELYSVLDFIIIHCNVNWNLEIGSNYGVDYYVFCFIKIYFFIGEWTDAWDLEISPIYTFFLLEIFSGILWTFSFYIPIIIIIGLDIIMIVFLSKISWVVINIGIFVLLIWILLVAGVLRRAIIWQIIWGFYLDYICNFD